MEHDRLRPRLEAELRWRNESRPAGSPRQFVNRLLSTVECQVPEGGNGRLIASMGKTELWQKVLRN